MFLNLFFPSLRAVSCSQISHFHSSLHLFFKSDLAVPSYTPEARDAVDINGFTTLLLISTFHCAPPDFLSWCYYFTHLQMKLCAAYFCAMLILA